MTVEDFLSQVLHVSKDQLRSMAKTPCGMVLRLEGSEPGFMSPMTKVSGGLLRIGRYLFMVNWDGTTGSAQNLSQEKYK